VFVQGDSKVIREWSVCTGSIWDRVGTVCLYRLYLGWCVRIICLYTLPTY